MINYISSDVGNVKCENAWNVQNNVTTVNNCQSCKHLLIVGNVDII